MNTKKTYEAVAKALMEARKDPFYSDGSPDFDSGKQHGIDEAAKHIATYFKQDNPAFQRLLFLKAAGVQV